MPLDRHKTVTEALEYVSRHPDWPNKDFKDIPVWEIVARNLFKFSLDADTRVIGAVARSTRAQRIIMDRLTGTRQTGTSPAVYKANSLQIKDLAGLGDGEDTIVV